MTQEKTDHQNLPVYASHAFDYYLFENFLKEKYDQRVSVYKYGSEKLRIKKDDLKKFTEEVCSKFKLHSSYRSDIVLRGDNTFVIVKLSNDEGDALQITTSSEEEANGIIELAKSYICTEQRLSVRWIYAQDGSSMDLNGTVEEEVSADLYPFIEDFDTFNERFFASKSNILLLIGEPGTGKTTFIKNLLLSSNSRCYLTYDERVLSNDYTFASFMGDPSANAFVIEDADLFLRSRTDGNGMVSRFLNVGDGIVKIPNKKLIFSTNLPNITDIDPALIRPGRCFQIINFRKLTREEAKVVADNRNILLPGSEDKKEYTLAEIFNNPVAKPKEVNRKFGFC